MTPEICTVKHDPANGTYGDCVRACVASILDLDSEAVPHFYHDDADGAIIQRRMIDFLAPIGLAPFVIHYPGALNRDELFALLGEVNPAGHYMLFGSFPQGGDHVIVCKGGEVVHDPAWAHAPLINPGSNGYWTVMVLARA